MFSGGNDRGTEIFAMKKEIAIAPLAKRLFNAYNEQEPNLLKPFGREVPRWQELSDQVREKWMAVARAAVKLVQDA